MGPVVVGLISSTLRPILVHFLLRTSSLRSLSWALFNLWKFRAHIVPFSNIFVCCPDLYTLPTYWVHLWYPLQLCQKPPLSMAMRAFKPGSFTLLSSQRFCLPLDDLYGGLGATVQDELKHVCSSQLLRAWPGGFNCKTDSSQHSGHMVNGHLERWLRLK